MRCEGPDGGIQCVTAVRFRAEALRRLGLHPDQPTSAAAEPPAPKWWGPWGRPRS